MNKKGFIPTWPLIVLLVIFITASCTSGPGIVTITPSPIPSLEMLATPVLVTPTPPVSATPTCQGPDWPCSSKSMTMTAVMAPTLWAARHSATPTCVWPCPSDSLTLTAQMSTAWAATPSATNPPWATIVPSAGDLGWGSVYGKIVDGNTNLPINGATIRCEHFSYTSPYLCNGVTTTNSDGIYSFTTVFFHDTDKITLSVEAPGYGTLRFEQSFFTRPEFHADLGLFPATSTGATFTPTAYIMCTPPACPNGILACGSPNGCPGGCGTVCIASTPTP